MTKLELHKSESFQFGNLCPEIKCSNGNVAEDTSRAGLVQPVLPIQETGPESGKQEGVPGPELGKQLENVAAVDVIHAEDQTARVLPAHGTGWESGNQDNVPAVEIIHVKDQSTTKPVGNNR